MGLVSHCALAQHDQIPDSTKRHTLRIGVSALVSAKDELPFWLTANQSGRYSGHGPLGAVTTVHAFNDPGKDLFSLFYGIEGQVETGQKTTPRLIQAYGGVKLGFFDLRIGMKEEFFGVNDSTLSVGNLIYTNNARPIPKVVLETPGWVRSPILGNVFSFKAYLAHGWFELDRYQRSAFLHQKFLYIKAVALNQRLNFIGGLHHNAQWGGFNPDSEVQQPTGLKNYAKIILAQSGGDDALMSDQINALGNHLGTYDFNLSYDLGTFSISNYWQFIWEDRSGLTPFNWRDGLIGLSIKTKNRNQFISGINLELVRTSSQDAFKNDNGVEFIEPDNFLNNNVYRSGWTYHNRVIGNAMFFILNPESRTGTRIKNMINGLNVGLEGKVNEVSYRLNYLSFKNHGNIQERLSPALTLNLVSLALQYTKGVHHIGAHGAMEWGKYPGRNLGFRVSYARDLRF